MVRKAVRRQSKRRPVAAAKMKAAKEFQLESRPGSYRQDEELPATSKAAAKAMTPHTKNQYARVLQALAGAHPSGLADWDIQQEAEISQRSTAAARRQELRRDGMVRNSGRTKPNPNPDALKKTPVKIWELTIKGQIFMGVYQWD